MFVCSEAMLVQSSFEDMGAPLAEVTFCVVDLETTGSSPLDSAITEVGAVKVCRGEVVGTFQSLVDPRGPIPAFIRMLTGIGEEMVRGAPSIEAVLPNFLEFARGTVLVAHNARFDVSFLNVALDRCGYEPLTNRVVDTAALARKILGGEVPNRKLETLARHLRCAHHPTHRAFADALATVDVLHGLIERLAGFGVTTLDDLVAISYAKLDGTFSKIALAEGLPRSPGIYRFLGAMGEVLYVGVATDLRARVRSYFYGDVRRRMRDLLRATQEVTYETYPTTLEAEIAEARAIARERPPFNRSGKRGRSGGWYLKVGARGKAPRLAAARTPRDDGSVYVGPFPGPKIIRRLIDTLRDAAPIHRCTEPARCRGCAFSEMGACVGTEDAAHREVMARLRNALTDAPSTVLAPLEKKMWRLARSERFEEAAELRARSEHLERVLERHVRMRALVEAGRLAFALDGRALLVVDGQLAAATDLGPGEGVEALERLERAARYVPVGAWLPHEVHAEVRLVSSLLERHADRLRLLYAAGPWRLPVGAGPRGRFAVRGVWGE